MTIPFLFMIGLQATFVLGLVWFWMETWEGDGLPSGSWLVAVFPVATFGVGMSIGPEVTFGGAPHTQISLQIAMAIAATWLSYGVGAMITLQEANARRVPAETT